MAMGTLRAAFAGLSLEAATGSGNVLQSKGGATFNQRPIFSNGPSRGTNVVSLPRQQQARVGAFSQSACAVIDTDFRSGTANKNQRGGYAVPLPEFVTVLPSEQQQSGKLPQALYRLLDPQASVDLPSAHLVSSRQLDNRELDKLFAALGRNKITWRRALVLHEWLLSMGHIPDDRLCTTLIRVCSQHGQTMTALSLYDWMRSSQRAGGAGLVPTVYTYTAAMRAALTGSMIDRAVKVWDDAITDGCQPDCRMATTLIEVCTRKGDTSKALATYQLMKEAGPGSSMVPSVHAYTAAMRAAAEGGAWDKALDIWSDMEQRNCKPTGHAYAAVISACAAGGAWQRAVQLFDQMLQYQIKPDVVSCTALITALGADGQWKRGSQVVDWMLRSGVKPNVRTYTALITALGNAQKWDLALDLIKRMKMPQAWGTVEPNAYTYSALLKAMGEQGNWQLAENLFQQLEEEARTAEPTQVSPQIASPSSYHPHAVDWTSSQPTQADADSNWEPQKAAINMNHMAVSPVVPINTSVSMVEVDDRRMSSGSFGDMPTHLAEQVLDSPTHAGCTLPDNIPGQANPPQFQSFSFFSAAQAAASSSAAAPQQLLNRKPTWTNPTISGLQLPHQVPVQALQQPLQQPGSAGSDQSSHAHMPAVPSCLSSSSQQGHPLNGGPARWGLDLRGTEHKSRTVQAAGRVGKGPINEVVCGAMMLAYERAGKWEQAVLLLRRSRAMGIIPNTIMYNTAMSSLGKSGHWEAAETLFGEVPEPDSVTFETLIAAYGMAGQAEQAELAFKFMLEANYQPRDYAYCALVAAHSMQGNWKAALRVKHRMKQAGLTATVHVYNALIAACERAQQLDLGVEITKEMRRAGVEPNSTTMMLMQGLGSKGVALTEKQQVAAAALSAAVAAAGHLAMRTGMW